MNIFYDFSAIKTGGGLQLMINFLTQLENNPPNDERNNVILISDSINISVINTNRYIVVKVPSNYIKRIFFEYFMNHIYEPVYFLLFLQKWSKGVWLCIGFQLLFSVF